MKMMHMQVGSYDRMKRNSEAIMLKLDGRCVQTPEQVLAMNPEERGEFTSDLESARSMRDLIHSKQGDFKGQKNQRKWMDEELTRYRSAIAACETTLRVVESDEERVRVAAADERAAVRTTQQEAVAYRGSRHKGKKGKGIVIEAEMPVEVRSRSRCSWSNVCLVVVLLLLVVMVALSYVFSA